MKREEKILKGYKEYFLEHGHAPKSVYAFCKPLKIPEEKFYDHFSGFQAIDKAIWEKYFSTTVERVEGDEVWGEYSAREKLLAFYYTLFEELKKERSYVTKRAKTISLMEGCPHYLSGFKKHFDELAEGLVNEGIANEEIEGRMYLSKRYAKLHWPQFLYILKTWVFDKSDGFQRTDTSIEKSVNLGFDLMGRNFIDSALDFGKFVLSR